ncbi:MAG: 50S ribosomal protein L10, partial [Pyrobaculum sp.]
MLALGKREYGREKPYPLGKRKAVDEAVKLLSQYDYIFVLDLHKLSAKILHEYRYRLRPHGVVKVIKPTLFRIALGRFGAPPEVLEKTSGEIGLFFTNLNPAEVVKLVARHSVQRAARPGDKAPFDIIVPAGPTNASPGPIISKFGKLKIP